MTVRGKWRIVEMPDYEVDYPDMMAAVRNVNGEIRRLAPVLNSPTVDGGVAVAPADPATRIDAMAKLHEDSLYHFAVAPRDETADVVFRPDPALVAAGADGALEVEVLGEGRTQTLRDGAFRDRFEGYEVHLYRIPARTTPGAVLDRFLYLPRGLR